MEIDEVHALTLAVTCMYLVECGSTLKTMLWCRCHTFVVNSDDNEGLPWFVCSFDCRVRLERFIFGNP